MAEEDNTRTFQTETILHGTEQGRTISSLVHLLTHNPDPTIVTAEGEILVQRQPRYSHETLRQVAEQTGGKFFSVHPDPNYMAEGGFPLEDFVWALETLNRTEDTAKSGSVFSEEDFEPWKQCFGLIGNIGAKDENIPSAITHLFTGKAMKQDENQPYAYDDVYVEIVPKSRRLDSPGVIGYKIFAKFYIWDQPNGDGIYEHRVDEGSLKCALREFLESEQKSGRIDPNIEAEVDNDNDGTEERVYVTFTWKNYKSRGLEEISSNETLQEIFARKIPEQIENLGAIVISFFSFYEEEDPNLVKIYSNGLRESADGYYEDKALQAEEEKEGEEE